MISVRRRLLRVVNRERLRRASARREFEPNPLHRGEDGGNRVAILLTRVIDEPEVEESRDPRLIQNGAFQVST
jgi:hypothetical protein